MPRLLIATTNPDKLREIRRVLADVPVDLVSLRDLPAVPDPQETGATFQENARLKARYYDASLSARARADLPPSRYALRRVSPELGISGSGGGKVGPYTAAYTVAEDSGLVIDALGGEPGVYSARFHRPDASYPERFAEIYRRLAEQPAAPRRARFVCALAVIRDGELVYETTGRVEGEIAPAPRGTRGFGYDPIFYYPPYGGTLAEVTEEDKLRIAHRGQAFRNLARWLRSSLRATEAQSHRD